MLVNETNEEQQSESLLVTATELAKLLKLSTRSVWRLLSAGQLPQPVRFGGTVRWRSGEIREWIDAGCPKPSGRDH